MGVPEASLDLWANQFVAKGYKIARVDQMESKLSKDMRERDGGGGKEAKIIHRELASVLTSGTLVDGGKSSHAISLAVLSCHERGYPANARGAKFSYLLGDRSLMRICRHAAR